MEIGGETLTRMLRSSGVLTGGRVTGAQVRPSRFSPMMSQILDLRLRYDPGSRGRRPDHCLMKVMRGSLFHIGRAEASFYRLAVSGPPGLVECYGTWIDDDRELAIVLLADEGDAFRRTEWPLPPPLADCERIVRVLARIHSHWWEADSTYAVLEHVVATLPQQQARLAERISDLFDRLGDRLSSERRRRIENLAAEYPRLHRRRAADTRRQTLVHGDAHVWNFLVPEDPDRDPLLVDWQLWSVDFGVSDLVYMIGLHWFPERRGRFERQLLDVYLDELQCSGISYSLEELRLDYRMLAARLPLQVASYAAVIPASIWWPHLDRAFSAFDDLDCSEFFPQA